MTIKMYEFPTEYSLAAEQIELPYDLTVIEYRDLIAASHGMSKSEYAKHRFVTKSTVKFHRNNLIRKMGVENIQGAVGKAIRERAITIGRVHQSARLAHLSPREHEVLELIAQGMTNGAIAENLNIKAGTVNLHVDQILSKLDAENRVHAIRRGYEYGELELPEIAAGNQGENYANVIPIGIGQVSVASANAGQEDFIPPAA
jgi:DNA-binding NarL/FixJ family response regulator